jgi:hypothetical protein
MKKLKKKINDFIDMLPFLILQFLPVVALVVFLVFAYWISVSDLPDWFKYVLLR